MNEQSFREPINPADNFKQNDQGANSPVLNPDLFDDKSPEDVAFIQETPMSATAAAVDPMDETIVHETPVEETETHEAPVSADTGSPAPLLSREEAEHLRTRWNDIQGKFVDEPRSAVQQADELVSEVIGQITQIFAKEHNSLEGQWKQDVGFSTEDLRIALQHYRSFFNRLLS